MLSRNWGTGLPNVCGHEVVFHTEKQQSSPGQVSCRSFRESPQAPTSRLRLSFRISPVPGAGTVASAWSLTKPHVNHQTRLMCHREQTLRAVSGVTFATLHGPCALRAHAVSLSAPGVSFLALGCNSDFGPLTSVSRSGQTRCLTTKSQPTEFQPSTSPSCAP